MRIKDLKNSVAIIGYHDGSAGQISTWFEAVTGYNIACFVVDNDIFPEVNIEKENKNRVCQTIDFPQNGTFKGRPLIASSKWIEAILGMGIRKVISLEPNNQRRLQQLELIKTSELKLVSAIHPSVIISPDARIEKGVWINAGCIIGYKAEINSGVIINTGVQIDHHNVLEECCQVDPGVVTAGNVVLRKCCHIHTAATIINRVEIGTNTIIGAGTVVIRNIPSNCTAVGNPARIIKVNGEIKDLAGHKKRIK